MSEPCKELDKSCSILDLTLSPMTNHGAIFDHLDVAHDVRSKDDIVLIHGAIGFGVKEVVVNYYFGLTKETIRTDVLKDLLIREHIYSAGEEVFSNVSCFVHVHVESDPPCLVDLMDQSIAEEQRVEGNISSTQIGHPSHFIKGSDHECLAAFLRYLFHHF